MTRPYHVRLSEMVARRGSLCVGVDPHESMVRAWGCDYDLAGVERVSRDLVAAIGPRVAVYKPQAAFFECFGSKGVAVLSRVLADIAACGALSILDVKRGDIGSTMGAYARAYLSGETDLSADAITLSPYLGFGSLQPAIDLAHQSGRGIYVLARTSNPEGAQVQMARRDGRSLAQYVVDEVNRVNSESGLNAVGLVIGATLSSLECDLSGFSASILAPGIGAQGARIEELAELFGTSATMVLASVSRGIMSAGPDTSSIQGRVEAFQRYSRESD